MNDKVLLFDTEVYSKVHKFVNISAILVILAFAALLRASSSGAVDLAGMLVDEPHLR